MIRLFKYEGYKLEIAPETALLKPFKTLLDRDKTKTKDKALMEIGYIYFMEDPRSTYQMYVDRDIREEKIKEGEGIPAKWKPDKAVLAAMEFYSSFKSTTALLLEDTRVAVDKLRKLLKDIDLSEVDDKGRPIYTLNTITATIRQVPLLVKELDDAEKTLAKDLVQSDKVRGAQEKSMYEDM